MCNERPSSGTASSEYAQALAGEGGYWDDFVTQRLLNGEIPGSIDWRLTFSQFRYNHKWLPLALGPQLINFRLPQIRDLLLTTTPKPGMRILDLGCGAGWLSLEMARRGANVTALDISPSNLALARYLAETNERNFPFLYQGFAGLSCRLEEFGSIEYLYADLNKIELPPAEYDAVVVWDSLHHVAELERLLEQVRATLKPNGIFIGVDHSFATTRTQEFNQLFMPHLKDFYSWVTDNDPEWFYDGACELARQQDLGVLAVDYDPTPIQDFGPFAERLLSEMLDVVRGIGMAQDGQRQSGVTEEESPFEDVSADRLMRALTDRFEAGQFYTVCPLIQPDRSIPHYRNEKERIFQHYMAAALVNFGEQAIRHDQADGQWFFFNLTPNRPAESAIKPKLPGENPSSYIDRLETELERKNAAIQDLDARLRQREAELIQARAPRLPWKRRRSGSKSRP